MYTLLVVWVAAAAVPQNSSPPRNWIPLDEGVLAHSAEHVMAGQLPQRDFSDVYTGGLSQFDALVFETLGTRLVNLRWAMFVVFLLWVPALFCILLRLYLLAAGIATLLCVVLGACLRIQRPCPHGTISSLPALALLRLRGLPKPRGHAGCSSAGLAGGASVLVKVVGFYDTSAGALLFFVWEELAHCTDGEPTDKAKVDTGIWDLCLSTPGALRRRIASTC